MHLFALQIHTDKNAFGIEYSKAVLDFQVAQTIQDRLIIFAKQYHPNALQTVKLVLLKINAQVIRVKIVVWLELMEPVDGFLKTQLVNYSKLP